VTWASNHDTEAAAARLRNKARSAPEDLSDLTLSQFHLCATCTRLVRNFEPCPDCTGSVDRDAFANSRNPDRAPTFNRGHGGKGNN
jgi:predicted amidophosphoribosyltransferase